MEIKIFLSRQLYSSVRAAGMPVVMFCMDVPSSHWFFQYGQFFRLAAFKQVVQLIGLKNFSYW